jgi:hypothetical protein
VALGDAAAEAEVLAVDFAEDLAAGVAAVLPDGRKMKNPPRAMASTATAARLLIVHFLTCRSCCTRRF